MKKTQFFMLGIIAALGALFLELLVFTAFHFKIDPSDVYADSFNLTVVLSVFLEEAVKIIILFQILKKLIREAAERKHIFLSAIMAGLGFSALEIFFNLFNSPLNRSLSFGDVFGLLIVHTGTFAILGYALAKKTDLSFPAFVLWLPLTFLFHWLYNSLIIYQLSSGFYFLFTLLSLMLMLAFFWDLKRPLKNKGLPKSKIGLYLF